MVSIDKRLVEDLIEKNEEQLNNHHSCAISNLKRIKKENHLSSKENNFLGSIIKKTEKFNLATLSFEKINDLVAEIGENPKTKKRKFAGNSKKTVLKDEILKALGYKEKRSSFYPAYFNSLGLKACVYCNAQLAVSVERVNSKSNKKELIAKYQVDHYHSKSKYPYLSIALFNLYPVCGTCNLIKSDKSIEFQLYKEANQIDYNEMKFSLDLAKKAKFLISRNRGDLSINFSNKNFANYDKTFQISGIYNTQVDVAEEIILKSLAYDDNLRKHLKKLGKLNDALINKIILGNYTEKDEIHNRPLAKFMQDIGREVGIIPK